jgi:hypothetical protein
MAAAKDADGYPSAPRLTIEHRSFHDGAAIDCWFDQQIEQPGIRRYHAFA